MKKFKLNCAMAYLLSLLIGLAMSACSDKDVEPQINTGSGTENYFENSMDFSSDGGQKTLSFNSNVDWSLTVSSTQNGNSWCTLSQSSGKAGEQKVIVTVDKNEGYDDRNVVITLKAGALSKNVIVNQKQKNAITFTTDRFEIDNNGGTIDIEVRANIEYEVEVPQQYSIWITQSARSRGLSSNKVSFIIDKNSEYDKREGQIIFKSGNITETVKVYQSGNVIIVLSQNEYTVGCEGGEITIDISSNFSVDIDMPDEDWVKSAEKTRALSSHTLAFIIEPNATYDNREAVIVFKDPNSDKKESVSIKQRQKDALILSNDKIEVPQDGGNFSVKVNSNIDYSVEIPSKYQSWISYTGSRSLSETNPTFSVTASQEYDKREGEIYFKYKDIEEIVKVYQSGGPVIILNKTSYDLGGGSSTITIELKSNIAYNVSVSDSWIKEVSSRAVSSSSKTFNIEANRTGENRKGKITFTTSDGKRSEDVIISQTALKEANSIKFIQYSTSYNYGSGGKVIVSCTPANADVDYEWTSSDSNIMTVNGNGDYANVKMVGFGNAKVIVTEKNSGLSAEIGITTMVTGFYWENGEETLFENYDLIPLAIGDTYELKYRTDQGYPIPYLFANNSNGNMKYFEKVGRIMSQVNSLSSISLDDNGVVTGIQEGIAGLQPTGWIQRNNSKLTTIYFEVVDHYKEKEDNNTMGTANLYRGPIEFSLMNQNDVDYFKVRLPSTTENTINYKVKLESLSGYNMLGHKIEAFDSSGQAYLSSNPSGTSTTCDGWIFKRDYMYICIRWRNEYNSYWNYNHRVKMTIIFDE